MNRTFKIFAVLLMLVAGKCLHAQVDPHFSQYYVYPSWLNPALTGAFDGDYRVSGIYRNQWNNIIKPFTTPGLAVDFNTNKNLNVGFSIMNQTAGDGGYNYLNAYGSLAYTGIRFGTNGTQRMVFGMQAGIVNRKFNPSKFTLGDQWNPITGYNPGNATTDVFTKNNSMVFDMGAGLMYYDAQPGKKANVFAGFSANHLTQPDDPFSTGSKEKLPMRFAVHGGVRLLLSESLSFTPNALYVRQGNNDEKMVGGYAQIKAGAYTDFLFGVNYRFNDAIAPFVGFYHKNMVLGASYDINTSDLGRMAKGASSFEISLSFIGRKSVKTPEEPFICPRL